MAHSGIALLGLAVVVVPLVVFGGIYAVNATVQESARAITVENESFAPNASKPAVELNNSKLDFADYNDTVTVRNASTGRVFPEAGNYTWNDANGTISVTSNSDLDNASQALITYGYDGLSRAQAGVTAVITTLTPVLGEFVIVFGGVLVLAGLLVIGRAA